MADEIDEVKGQFTFCSLCRMNHDLGRKHIYSRKHQSILGRILMKFGKKVDETRKFLKKPSVQDGELEPGSRFWCHFCSENVGKHVTDRDITVKFGGLFEHFASDVHKKSVHKFWWEHGADKNLKIKFLINRDEFGRYKEEVDKMLREFELQMEQKRQQTLSLIKQKETSQALASQQPPAVLVVPEVVYKSVQNDQGVFQNPTGWHEGQRVWGGGIIKYRTGSNQWFPWIMDKIDEAEKAGPSGTALVQRFQTAQAYGENLTCIRIPELKEGEGNVHTGATPPWMRDDDDQDSSTEKKAKIGPSYEAFKKHIEQMKKINNKNPQRVGANFDRKRETSDDWLPSFGRVWNQGPRWQSRHEFKGESGKALKKKKHLILNFDK